MPYFVHYGKGVRRAIEKMPGQFQLSIDELLKELRKSSLDAIILFGIPKSKDAKASGAYSKNGIIQQAAQAVKDKCPDIAVFTDVCLCEYTDHGQCGIVRNSGPASDVDNDATLDLLRLVAVSHAKAGADCVCPSAMMDNQVAAIREALDDDGFKDTPIMSYSAKFASSFYGPFRDAAQSAPRFGDRKGYQLSIESLREAILEIELDVKQGADIVMVKPALAYLDVLREARNRFLIPFAAYSVSGEYSMVKAAGKFGFMDEIGIRDEIIRCISRAGADIIITYWAKELQNTML